MIAKDYIDFQQVPHIDFSITNSTVDHKLHIHTEIAYMAVAHESVRGKYACV